jgi:hypothetical protein
MSHDSAEYGWEQLQQRLEQKFCKYFQNDSETSDCKQKNPPHQHHSRDQKNKERSEIN